MVGDSNRSLHINFINTHHTSGHSDQCKSAAIELSFFWNMFLKLIKWSRHFHWSWLVKFQYTVLCTLHCSCCFVCYFLFLSTDLVHCTNEPNVSIPHLANLLVERTQNANWVVVYKSLITVHHLLAYGNEVNTYQL